MKCQYLWALPVLALFTLASCSNDDTAQENNGKQKGTPAGMTEFAVKEATTRTMGVYSGSGIDFYWTQGDKLWINNTSSLVQMMISQARLLPPSSILQVHTMHLVTLYVIPEREAMQVTR